TLQSKIRTLVRHPSLVKDIVQGKSLPEIRSKVLVSDRLKNLHFPRPNTVYLGDHKALTRTIFGHKMYLDTRDIILAPHLVLDGYWELPTTKVLLANLKAGMSVVEIGANIGYYSVLISSTIGETGKLFAFEPNPEIYKILQDNIEINGYYKRTTLENKAVIDDIEEIAFHISTRDLSTSSIANFSQLNLQTDELKHLYTQEQRILKVNTTSLDRYFDDFGIKIDLIKMDAEGSEPRIFDGMKNIIKNNPNLVIICESNPPVISASSQEPKKFLEQIRSYGFPLKYIGSNSVPVEVTVEKLLEMGAVDLYLKRPN